ncbi:MULTISPECIES: helix-turn-helix domain-containing protein [Chryseobacterium]|uniref:Transcriptional regulator, AraC family n=1 Tax=Chryseobacterium wanjuense TaxID=356305 RepID=A0A1I0QZX9_9FLAO|nr:MULTISPECIES: helix-turn-helix domain-containing protein [Chryseobacterium]KYH08255.1 AraC family transcriptional regulator [Chryseobacterium cucumeris]SEW33461.1 transcriptional regulator, AraC family [Chryseobacterium wanjuense]
MYYNFFNKKRGSHCKLWINDENFGRDFYTNDKSNPLLTIAWNKNKDQSIEIDGVFYHFKRNTVICLMVNQTFHFEDASEIIAWQFNRDFYCIESHDKEVSCVGFLFYGTAQAMFIEVESEIERKLDLLLKICQEEFLDVDDIQEDMLRMLFKRLIILVTRLAKKQYVSHELPDHKLNIIREYNLLVEKNYKTEHSVKFYAEILNKSPKTLSNIFKIYGDITPSSIIQQRILLEAKRLLLYTSKSSKEIAYELGFEDISYFSNFFKRLSGLAPSSFKHKNLVKSN